MSHYDPYQDNNDSYYNPQSNVNNKESVVHSIGSAIGETAKSLVGQLIVHTVVKSVGKLAGRGIANAQRSRATMRLKQKNLSSSQRSMYQRLSKAETFTDVLSARSKTFDRVRTNAWRQKSKNILEKRENVYNRLKTRNPIGAEAYKVKSAFKNSDTFMAVAMHNVGESILEGSIIGYAYDAATGQLGHMGVRDDLSTWNLPGHAVNYAKYMVKNAVNFGVMGNLGNIKRFGQAGAANVGKNFLKHNKGFEDAVLGFASKVSNVRYKGAMKHGSDTDYKAQAFQHEINDSLLKKVKDNVGAALSTYTDTIAPMMHESLHKPFQRKPTKTPQPTATQSAVKFQDKVKHGLDQVKNSFEHKRNERANRLSKDVDKGGFAIADVLSDMGARSNNQSVLTQHGNSKQAIDEMLMNQKSSRGFLAQMFGLQQTSLKDTLTKDKIADIAHGISKFTDTKEEMLIRQLGNVKVGNTFFKKGKFNVDMNYMNPLNVVKRGMANILQSNAKMLYKLPMVGKSLSLGAITMSDTILGTEYNAFSFNNTGTGFGFVVGTKGGPKQIDDLLREPGILKQGSNTSGVNVHMVNDKLYAIDGATITKLDSYNVAIKETSPASKSLSEMKKHDMEEYLYQNAKNTVPTSKSEAIAAYANNIKKQRDGLGFFGKLSAAVSWDKLSSSNAMQGLKEIFNMKIMPNGQVHSVKQQLYDQMVGSFYGKDPIFNKQEMMSVGRTMLESTEHHLANVINRPHVIKQLAERSSGFMNKNNLGWMWDDTEFVQLLREGRAPNGVIDKDFYKTFLSDDESKALYHTVIQNPRRAKKHITRDRVGARPDLDALTQLRTKFAMNGLGKVEGVDRMLSGADFLHRQGLISHSEATAMKLHGKLNTMFAKSKTYFGELDPEIVDLTEMQKLFKGKKDGVIIKQNELLDYVMQDEMRKPSLVYSKARLADTLYRNPDAPMFGLARDTTQAIGISYKSDSDKNMAMGLKVLNVGANRVSHLVSDTFNAVGIGGFEYDNFRYGTGMSGSFKYLANTAGKVAAAAFAYKAIDAAVASAPVFDQTGLQDGITGFLADNVATTHLIASKALNFTGVAGAGRYLEGLMPGFTSSAPGALIGGALRMAGGPGAMIGGAIHGAIWNRMLSAYMPDFTKTYEQLQKEYSGEEEVAIVEGKGWLLGTTPFQGNKIVGYKPNWYVEAKSRWKASDTLYGSEFRKLIHEPLPGIGANIGDIIDPYYMERKHFFDRPYPVTGGFLDEVPVFGPLIDATLGKIFKPKKLMHQKFLNGDSSIEHSEVTAMPVIPMSEQSVHMRSASPMKTTSRHIRSNFMGAWVYPGDHASSAQMIADDYMAGFENMMGLVGFAGGVGRTNLVEHERVVPTLETAGRMASMTRSYNDMALGGIGTLSEAMRRFVGKPDHRKVGVNPIPNMLPNFLPGRFLTGDPYEKIMKGELRLPGTAYERTHDINYAMPGRASMFGGNLKDIVAYFTGHKSPLLKEEHDILEYGTHAHEAIQNWLKAENILISAENLVYDTRNNVSGHIDGVIRDGTGGGGRRALEIKTISAKGLKKLSGPKNQHVGQLNFYLHEMKMKKGTILYVNRDNPAEFKVYEINYNRDRYTKDLQKIHQARKIASGMIAQSKTGISKGFSYSWTDRLNILADVAPASKEFKEAKWIVEQQIKNGMMDERGMNKYRKALKHRQATLRTYELYPTRFRGQILSPDAEYNRQNENYNIKAGAEYSLPERIVGAVWEEFLNTNTFLTNKFFAFKDPLEHYSEYQVYGKEYTPWTDPYGSFVKPRIDRVLGSTDPFKGAIAGSIDGAYLFGGSPMAAVGAFVGAAVGGVNGIMKRQQRWLPGNIKTERQINDYFDTLEYYKNERMATLSYGMEYDRYKNAANATFHSLIQNESTDYTNIYRSAYTSEKPYLSAWLNETNPERQEEILKIVPERLGNVLVSHWQKEGSKVNTEDHIDKMSAGLLQKHNPEYDMRMLDPMLRTEDIKLKAINNAGLNAHDFGLGWAPQLLRAQDAMDRMPDPNINQINFNENNADMMDPGTVKGAIMNMLHSMGLKGRVTVFINNHVDGGSNKATITLQHNRVQEIRDAVDFRERYM